MSRGWCVRDRRAARDLTQAPNGDPTFACDLRRRQRQRTPAARPARAAFSATTSSCARCRGRTHRGSRAPRRCRCWAGRRRAMQVQPAPRHLVVQPALRQVVDGPYRAFGRGIRGLRQPLGQPGQAHPEHVDAARRAEPGQQVGAGDPPATDRFVDHHGGPVQLAGVSLARVHDPVRDHHGRRASVVPQLGAPCSRCARSVWGTCWSRCPCCAACAPRSPGHRRLLALPG